MTIAMCCLTPEGVVLGADSTTSVMTQGGSFHYLNYNQKLFQIGEAGCLGAVTWGLATLGTISHRTQFALLADELEANPPASVQEVANRWIQRFAPVYQAAMGAEIARCRVFHAKTPHDPSQPPAAQMRTRDEERTYIQLRSGLLVGFFIAGYNKLDRIPHAYRIQFDPLSDDVELSAIPMGLASCAGAPKIFGRLVKGIDPDLRKEIIASGKWSGTPDELDTIIEKHQLYNPRLPIRDAIDFVYTCILSTIKVIKSSYLPQTCGGPIEVAVITTDRQYRWVQHKEWNAAISEGAPQWQR